QAVTPRARRETGAACPPHGGSRLSLAGKQSTGLFSRLGSAGQLFGGRIFAFLSAKSAGKTAASAAPLLPRRKDVKSSRPGDPSRRVGPPQRARSRGDRLALSPPALFVRA